MRTKKCKVCKEKFTPMRPLQAVCSYKCGGKLAKLQREKNKEKEQKDWRKEKKKRKDKLKTRSEWLNDLQKVFNKYIRERDKEQPCISCDKPKGAEQAGHYRSVGGSPELRFNENNCFGQCISCNMHKHGNLIEYRKRLIKRIGQEQVDYLERNDHEPLKLTVDEIKDIIKHYRAKTRSLKG